jgi:hypothetical protein
MSWKTILKYSRVAHLHLEQLFYLEVGYYMIETFKRNGKYQWVAKFGTPGQGSPYTTLYI